MNLSNVMLVNRLKKRFSILSKQAQRDDVNCFRVYERDLPDFPFILDYYDGEAVVWLYHRRKDDTAEKQHKYKSEVLDSVLQALPVDTDEIHFKIRQKQKGLESQYKKLSRRNIIKVVKEQGLSFEVNLHDYLDTGLFLDHRKTRRFCQQMSKNKRVLNLFSYTGSFTCYALLGGAKETTTVDMNKGYLEWAKRNLALNGFECDGKNRLVLDNCLSFIKHEAGQRKYDLIICDPPTFSNSKKMKHAFSIDHDYVDLIRACCKLLSPQGTLIFSTNSRSFKMDVNQLSDTLVFKNITHKTIPFDFNNKKIHQCWLIKKIPK